jgi:hypothetical protein
MNIVSELAHDMDMSSLVASSFVDRDGFHDIEIIHSMSLEQNGNANVLMSISPLTVCQLSCNFNFNMNIKASKTLQGEMYRVLEMNQLLATVERAAESLITGNRKPAIIITVSRRAVLFIGVRVFPA